MSYHGDSRSSDNSTLQHWKYIKRWREGDKWKYLYPDDESKVNKSMNILDKVANAAKKAVDDIRNDVKKKVDDFGIDDKKKLKEATEKVKEADTKIKDIIAIDVNPKTKSKALADAQKEYKEAAQEYVKANSSYMKTPMAKIDKAAKQFTDGVKKVGEFLDSIVETKGEKEAEEWDKYVEEQNAKKETRERRAALKKELDEMDREREEAEEKARQEAEEKARQEAREKEIREERVPELAKLLEDLKQYNPLGWLPLKKEATTIDEDMEDINENYDPRNPNTSMNCAYCTLAMDLRRRGYDVEAIEEVSDITASTILDFYKAPQAELDAVGGDRDRWERDRIHIEYDSGGSLTRDEAVNSMNKTLASYGEGARGHIVFYWTKGSAHSIYWEVENGQPVYRDTQLNRVIDIYDYVGRSRTVAHLRLDDLIPNKTMFGHVKADVD